MDEINPHTSGRLYFGLSNAALTDGFYLLIQMSRKEIQMAFKKYSVKAAIKTSRPHGWTYCKWNDGIWWQQRGFHLNQADKTATKTKSRHKPSTLCTCNSFGPLPIKDYLDADDNNYIHSGSGSSTSSSDSNIQEITNRRGKIVLGNILLILILVLISLPTVLPVRLLLNVVQQLASTTKMVQRAKGEK